ncbi:TrpB-like pyridoxal phosphate-dependent enzyme [Myxococcus dinghuensis]|uniref:TrpB-like pyridoxal phosphate-dependent enzyme n=1 Tax=Myxococcus dinghuensis TaxID=2906761 RepID=UPI002B1F8ECE|nr:TrpB-like pyridoxal phosphate-dependent enzyme [Myxococcus dinghuensis]
MPSMRGGSVDFHLRDEELPTHWYNFLPDLPAPLPEPRQVGRPTPAEIAARIRPRALLAQNQPTEPWVAIPETVIDRLIQCGRPTPLRRARQLEQYLQTPARIYCKREDQLVTGSFKLTTALAQAHYAREEGREVLVSETGAGQWGMAVALAGQMFGLRGHIFMARCSLEQKPYRQYFMELLGTHVDPSPSGRTRVGRELLARHPGHPGSIGSAISEAIEASLETPGAAYLSGSNINHVHLHQTLLGLEVRKQLALAGEACPDELIACAGGGSNLCGLMLPFLREKREGAPIRFLAVESTAAPRLTQGTYEYCRSDVAGYTPEVLAYSMGKDFVPEPVHVGGLRNHNSSPLVSLLRREGLLDAMAFDEQVALEAGRLLLKTEGILVAPESSHAVAAAIDSALRVRGTQTRKVIVLLASGSGFLDLEGYHQVLGGRS